jgi:DNA polymerase I-like protein with 3'-5' exonuclease and polymerase domains
LGIDPGEVTIDPPSLAPYVGTPVMTMGKHIMGIYMGGEERISEYHGHIHKSNGRLFSHTFGLLEIFKQPNFIPLVIGEIGNLISASLNEQVLERPPVLIPASPVELPESAVIDLEWDSKNRVTEVGFSDGVTTTSTPNAEHGLNQIGEMFRQGRLVIGHNIISADLEHIPVKPADFKADKIFDTRIAAHIVHPEWAGQGLYDLGSLVRYYFPTEDWKHDQYDNLYYNALDCAYTHRLYRALHKELLDTEQLHLLSTEQRLHAITIQMRRKGVKVDLPELRLAVDKKSTEKEALRKDLPVNPNSPTQVKKWLKEDHKIFVKDIQAETLGKLRGRHPDIDKMIDFRVDSKNISTWFDYNAEYAFPKFDVCGTNVARLSSSNPNFQNIPDGLRRFIIPRDRSFELLSVDASQGENRWVAYYAQDTEMLAGFDSGGDNHQRIADNISRVVGYEVTRDFGKTVVHASNYGETFRHLALRLFGNQLGSSIQKAKALQDGYFSAYPKTRAWQQKVQSLLDSGDITLRSAFNRRRPIFAMDSHERMKRGLHFFGCSSCADMVHLKVLEIYDEFGLVPLLIVHDEAVYEIEKGDDKLCRDVEEMLALPVIQQGGRKGAWGMKRGLNYGKFSPSNSRGLKKWSS